MKIAVSRTRRAGKITVKDQIVVEAVGLDIADVANRLADLVLKNKELVNKDLDATMVVP